MTDIVKRLNAPPVANHYYSPGQPLEGAVLTERREAAVEIERLRAALEEIARPYAADHNRLLHSERQIAYIARAALEAKDA